MTTTVHQPEPFLVIYHNWKHDPNQAQEIIMGKRENSEHLIGSSFCLGRMLLHVSNIWKELTSKPSSSVTEPENCISWVFTLRSGHNKENVINVISATRVESHPEISFPPALTHDGAAGRPAAPVITWRLLSWVIHFLQSRYRKPNLKVRRLNIRMDSKKEQRNICMPEG